MEGVNLLKTQTDIIEHVNKITILLQFAKYVKHYNYIALPYDKFCNLKSKCIYNIQS